MDELTLDDKKYLSSKRAAQITGYAKDYVGQLCREGRVAARLVGRNWYVLESSILEHRFGPEEPAEKPIPVPASPVSAWEAPTYVSEPVRLVPEIAPKPAAEIPLAAPAAPAEPQALKDMQSAWQDWFEQQKQEAPKLPDASGMLLEESYEDAPIPTAERAPEAVYEHIEAAEEPIHIERKVAPIEREEPQAVPLRRTYVPPAVAVSIAPKRVRGGARTRQKRGSGLMLRAFFLSVAGLAIVVALIGSGLVDQYVQGSQSSALTDILGGVNKISK